MVKIGIFGAVYETMINFSSGSVRLEIEPHDDADFEAVPVQVSMASNIATHTGLSIPSKPQTSGVSIPTEDREEAGLTHKSENVGSLCDVQRRLTGELRISRRFANDQMGQKIARGLCGCQ